MRNFVWALVLVSSAAIAAPAGRGAEDFKGPSGDTRVQVGGMGGLGIIGDRVATFQATGFAAFRVMKRGFVEDINDSVWAELQLGPGFNNAGIGLQFMPGLRWDFHKDDRWTFYGLGGLGGNVFYLGGPSQLSLFPRFAAGVMMHLNSMTYLRAELSHEFIGFGAGIAF